MHFILSVKTSTGEIGTGENGAKEKIVKNDTISVFGVCGFWANNLGLDLGV